MESLSNLRVVDFVTLNNTATAVNVIKKLRPHFYCKGQDYKNHKKDISGEIKNEVKAIKSVKGKIIYTKDITYSSGNLINRFYDLFSVFEIEIMSWFLMKSMLEYINLKLFLNYYVCFRLIDFLE